MPDEVKRGFFKNVWSMVATLVSTVINDLTGLWDYARKPELRKKVLSDLWAFLRELAFKIKKERVLREAASLTYTTILGFVPFVLFLVLIVPDLPFFNVREKIYMTIANNFMPTSALAINNMIGQMLTKRAGFNIINLVVLIVSSYSLFRLIRNTFDRILNMEYAEKQDVVSQLVKFFGTIILGVMLMVLMFSSSSLPLISSLLKMPLLQWINYVIPFLVQFVGLIFLYMLMPSIKVRRSSLIRGAFWMAVIWGLVKSVFDFYIYNLTSYQAVYGVLAAVPIFLLWIYLNWVIILGGIVMVAVFDSRKNPNHYPKEPNRLVRLTLELYSDKKLSRRLEDYISRKELKDLADSLDDGEEK